MAKSKEKIDFMQTQISQLSWLNRTQKDKINQMTSEKYENDDHFDAMNGKLTLLNQRLNLKKQLIALGEQKNNRKIFELQDKIESLKSRLERKMHERQMMLRNKHKVMKRSRSA